jgi:nicotinamidase-related amidase
MNLSTTALLLLDLQNDFLHPQGAYARAGQAGPALTVLPARLRPLAEAIRSRGGLIVSTLFTLVPGRGGDPIISPHLKTLRPFLGKGDFAPGSWGQQLVDTLAPADIAVEKIAYSAFYMSRLEWVLRKSGIERLYAAGIVTNGGVASTVRDDGCAAFSVEVHRAAIEGLRPVARIVNVAHALHEIESEAAI